MVSGHPSLTPLYWLGEGYHLFRAKKTYPSITPSALFAVLHDWDLRPTWDATLASLTTLAVLSPGTAARTDAVAQHITRPVLGGVVGAREFIFVASAKHEAVGTSEELHLSSCRWLPEAEAALAGDAPPKGCVRGQVFMGGVTLRHAEGGGTRVVMLTCAAPRGAIPRAAANMGGTRSAALLADLERFVATRGGGE